MTQRLQPRDHHSVYIDGSRTAVTVEWPIWERFKAIAALEGVTIGNLCAAIDRTMRLEPPMGVTSAASSLARTALMRRRASAIGIPVFLDGSTDCGQEQGLGVWNGNAAIRLT
jgi:predicted DNA-binding ribbon-helix-helix protein